MIGALLSLSLVFAPTLGFAPVKSGGEPLAPALEERAQKLGKGLRCATCQGLSVSDSPASMARSQLDKIRELIVQGKSDDEIKEYFVARYGEWVLLEPPRHGWNWLVWAGPGVLLVLGGVVIALQLRKGASQLPPSAAAAAGAGSTSAAPAADDPYLRALREESDR